MSEDETFDLARLKFLITELDAIYDDASQRYTERNDYQCEWLEHTIFELGQVDTNDPYELDKLSWGSYLDKVLDYDLMSFWHDDDLYD